MSQREFTLGLLIFSLFIVIALTGQISGATSQTTPLPATQVTFILQESPTIQALPTFVTLSEPEIILQRLNVSFHGQDGNKVIGSGCPGKDGRESIVDYHFSVQGVDAGKRVIRVVVTGDSSTLTWALPCSNNWELLAVDSGNGNWEVFIAPSEPAKVYTILFFYSDNTMALGMTTAP